MIWIIVVVGVIVGFLVIEVGGGQLLQWVYRRHLFRELSQKLKRESSREFCRFIHLILREKMAHHWLLAGSSQVTQPDDSYAYTTEFHPFRGLRWKESVRYWMAPAQSGKPDHSQHGVYTDQNRFIPNERGVSRDLMIKEPGVRRVLVLGGSWLAAGGSVRSDDPTRGLGNHETITAIAERELNQGGEGIRYEVVNAAVHGYASINDAAYYLFELSQLPHDMVILLNGYNDMASYWAMKDESAALLTRFELYHRMNLHIGKMLGMTRKVIANEERTTAQNLMILLRQLPGQTSTAIFWTILSRTYLRYFGSPKKKRSPAVEEVKKEKLPVEQPFLEPFVECYLRYNRHVLQVAQGMGIPAVAIFQPMLVTRFPQDVRESKACPKGDRWELQSAFCRRIRERIAGMEGASGWKDWAGVFDGDSELIYPDEIHYNEIGCRKLGVALAELIRAQFGVKKN